MTTRSLLSATRTAARLLEPRNPADVVFSIAFRVCVIAIVIWMAH